MQLNEKKSGRRVLAWGVVLFGALGGVETPQTSKIIEVAQVYAEKSIPSITREQEIEMTCLSSPQSDDTIGLKQAMRIQAPMDKVAAAIEDFPSYPKIIPDLKVARVDEKNGNIWKTFWEQRVPVFFVPNIKFRMIYELTPIGAQKKIYRYQLEKPNGVLQSDGIIVLQENAGGTDYLEYDFIDADWGVIRSFAGGKIWHESIKAIVISDFAIRNRSEHGDWSLDQVKKQSEDLSEKKNIEELMKTCLKNKIKIDMKRPLP